MSDDVNMASNPLVVPIKENKFEETPLNVNVSQRLRNEESFKKMVRI
jgi:hypothetical protein